MSIPKITFMLNVAAENVHIRKYGCTHSTNVHAETKDTRTDKAPEPTDQRTNRKTRVTCVTTG